MGNLGLLAYSIQWGSLDPLVYGGETGANFHVAWLCEKLVYFKMYPCFGIGAFSGAFTMFTMRSTILFE